MTVCRYMTLPERRARHLAMAEAYRAGKTRTEIARQFGVTGSMVKLALKKHGIAPAAPGRPPRERREDAAP